MVIKTAETAGFCFGVNRAIQMIYKLLDENKKVYTLGPIIHNPQMVQELADRGVSIVSDPAEVPAGGTLVVRSHGVPMKTMDEIRALGLPCCDATCPFVAKIHRIVQRDSADGNVIFIAGDPSHPEVEGIRGYCTGESFVFENADKLRELSEKFPNLSKKPLRLSHKRLLARQNGKNV